MQEKRKTWEPHLRARQQTQGWLLWLSTLPSFPTQDGTHSTTSPRKCRILRGKSVFSFVLLKCPGKTGEMAGPAALYLFLSGNFSSYFLCKNLLLLKRRSTRTLSAYFLAYQLYHTNKSLACIYVFYTLYFRWQFLKRRTNPFEKQRKSWIHPPPWNSLLLFSQTELLFPIE